LEYVYNCRRYQYESGEHITFYKRPIIAGNVIDGRLLDKVHDTSARSVEAENHCSLVSANRAKNKVYRIARSNVWDWFITLTFDRKKTDASDYDIIVYRLKVFLNHLQQRKCPNMKYLIVPELHSDGEHYHFHGFLANVDNLRFKFWKADAKKGLPIYNILDWGLGYTTATRIVDSARASSYITKYISKDIDEHLKEKRRFYYSRNCRVADEEFFLMNEEDFVKTYNDRISYVKSKKIPQANQVVTYYELSY